MSPVSKPMSNVHRYGISFRNLFIRNQFWPLLIPSITVLFLFFAPNVSSALKISPQENSDRTVAKLSSRDLQITQNNQQPFYSHDHTLYVATVDGKITAIDTRANGRQLWTADTGSPLIDSSVSKIEISGDQRSVRLIPSLIGGLYAKYDDDGHVEPLSFDAEALLDSSFKLHDDLVVTGGKHVDMLGLDMHTGQILYSFAKDETKEGRTNTDTNNSRATLVVKRTTQTVRARSARNGFEKWNFSVSNQELLQFHGSPSNIVVEPTDHHEHISPFSGYFNYQLQAGVIQAFDVSGEQIWSSNVKSPIAAVWELKNGQLREKSLFETSSALSTSSSEEEPSTPSGNSRRLAFVGEFNSTPYVIVSPRVQKQLIYDARRIAGFHQRRRGLSPWQKAYQKRTVYIDGDSSENSHQRTIGMETSDRNYPLALRPDPNRDHRSLSTLKTCDTAGYLELSVDLTDEDDEPKDDIIVSQRNPTGAMIATVVTLSSILLGAFFLGLFIYQKQKSFETLRQNSTMTETTTIAESTPPPTPIYHQIETPTPTAVFQSRYTLEYEHVRFLGRGGFGVVFEAINKLDERRVAIKRVSLKKASGKERALKEIRYLAVLNHPNLIQYYYAWNESPPAGWQEEEDKILLARHNQSTRDSISSFPTTGNDSESISQKKPPVIPLIDFTFDRSSNPLRIEENFSHENLSQAATSDINSSSEDYSDRHHLDPNNNRSTRRTRSSTTKSSISSSSPMFEHSPTSSEDENEENEEENHQSVEKEMTDESDGGILFIADEKRSSTEKSETKSIVERKPAEKDVPPTYFYFVMELCQPESLRDRLIQRSIDRREAWTIFDQIVRGIEYIHSQKLIHRDLKPSNILFSLDNTVRIGDFGLVSAFGEEKPSKKKERIEKRFHLDSISFTSDAGGNDEVGGTVLYMSPEQINHQPYNQKVDIYAMGIILFELLYPFSTQMERMRAINDVRLKEPIFPLDFERNENESTQFICQMIRWLLSYSPQDRPKAAELRQKPIYQTILRRESPQLSLLCDPRQTHSTLVQSEETISTAGLSRNSPSPFHRSHSSFTFQSHRNVDSTELKLNG